MTPDIVTEDFSDEGIRKNCPFCDPQSSTYKYFMEGTPSFRILCNANPLCEGDITIVPKGHVACVATYPDSLYSEFLEVYAKVSRFIKKNFGPLATFEHGVFGQTVYHSHVHSLPFRGKPEEVVPEGLERLTKIAALSELRNWFEREGGYLFFSIEDGKWVVDSNLKAPRFFRDRFARLLGRPERGNWKEMHFNPTIMARVDEENRNVTKLWQSQRPLR